MRLVGFYVNNRERKKTKYIVFEKLCIHIRCLPIREAQNYYDLEIINVEWSFSEQPAHCTDGQQKLTQNCYDLEKINVEWSGTLTTLTPKIITTSKK
jgi:hypothetical protein